MNLNSDTLTDYLSLIGGEKPQPKRASALLPAIFEQLIGPRRYADIAGSKPDFDRMLDEQLAEYDLLAARFASNPRAADLLSGERSAIVTRGTLYFEVLLANEQNDAANLLATRLVELDPTARTFLGLGRRAKRSGNLEAALVWVRRGVAGVPEDQRASLEVMAQSLERELASQTDR